MKIKEQKDTRKALQSVKLLIAKPAFQIAVEALRKKWGVSEENPSKDKNREHLQVRALWHYTLVKMNAMQGETATALKEYREAKRFYGDLLKLMRRFQLDSQYWAVTLWEYVRTGQLDEKSLASNLEALDTTPMVRFEVQPITYKRKIIIEIGEQTTLKDVKAAWREVEKLRERLSLNKPKFKEWENFDRDTRIYSLYEDGNTAAEICTAIEKEYGDDLDYGNIKKIVSTYRKKLGLPKGGKLATSRLKK